jgi:hypothetical protein
MAVRRKRITFFGFKSNFLIWPRKRFVQPGFVTAIPGWYVSRDRPHTLWWRKVWPEEGGQCVLCSLYFPCSALSSLYQVWGRRGACWLAWAGISAAAPKQVCSMSRNSFSKVDSKLWTWLWAGLDSGVEEAAPTSSWKPIITYPEILLLPLFWSQLWWEYSYDKLANAINQGIWGFLFPLLFFLSSLW